ncbi:MAG: class I SAM-dependent methyltransferase [Gammaproteobacteria bacterium]|nr:class I SAM-dependent methyltransferase [Gammaproteobacteria bacterium]
MRKNFIASEGGVHGKAFLGRPQLQNEAAQLLEEGTSSATEKDSPKVIRLPGPVPDYLQKHYWWAYVHPRAVRFWDRQWLINLILFGNFIRLRDQALAEFWPYAYGRTLQVACVYGDFTVKLAERIAPGGILDVVDVLPIQIQNLRRKLSNPTPVRLHYGDSTGLDFDDATFDQVIVFFVLHEQPVGVRERTVEEAVRVLKPGGKIVFVEYHRPVRWHPLHLVFLEPILRVLEPFSPDLWNHPITEWLPKNRTPTAIRKQLYFGNLYQKVVVTY